MPEVDGDLDDWQGIPFVPLNAGEPGPFSASIKVAWDDNHLYLAARVQDPSTEAVAPQQVIQRQARDMLGICLDLISTGRLKTGRAAFDDDNYCYKFTPPETGTKGLVFCDFAPITQADSGKLAPRKGLFDSYINCKSKHTPEGYIYEIAIPKARLMPLRFEKGISFGFSAAISDSNLKEGATKSLVALPDLDWRNPVKFLIATLVE